MDRRIKNNHIENAEAWEYDEELINKIMTISFLGNIVPVCKLQREDYNDWFVTKSLCTYFENWERLAYIVCDAYKIRIEAVEVVCNAIIDIAATPVECLLAKDIEVKTEEVKCDDVDIKIEAEQIKCDASIDIEAKAAECDLSVKVEAEEVDCDRKIDLEAFVADCSKKYNIEANLMKCIINDAFPQLSVLAKECPENTYMQNNIVDVITEIIDEE